MKKRILKLIETSAAFKQALRAAGAGEQVELAGLAGAARGFFLHLWSAHFPGQYLVITKLAKDAERIRDDLNEIAGERTCFHFPEWQLDPYQWKSPSGEIIGERLETLYNLQTRTNLIVTASVRALLEPTIAPAELTRSSLGLRLRQELALEQIVSRLVALGYERAPIVEEVGSFSVKGGIVDIFPHTTENPVRVELFGDFIESLRSFSVVTQRSLAPLEQVLLLPRRELMLSNEELDRRIAELPDQDAKILSDRFHFGIDNPGLEWAAGFFGIERNYLTEHLATEARLFLLEPKLLRAEAEELFEMFLNLCDRERPKYQNLPEPAKIFIAPETFGRVVEERPHLSELSFERKSERTVNFGMSDHPVINSQVRILKDYLRGCRQKGQTIFLACDTEVQRDRIGDILEEQAEGVTTAVLDLSEGFVFPDQAFAVLTDHQIFTRTFHTHRKVKIKEGLALSSYTNLSPGDFIVHVDYGIGRYRGLEELQIDGRRRDCLLILYEGDDRLFVPIEEFNRVQKYVGKEGHPQLTRLGGPGWQKLKARTKRAIADMAEGLIRLYAERKARPGFAFAPDSHWMRQLEASFPFEETEDQLKAIAEIKKDMEAKYPMDRLVCGDVGFGKTEVAIRAAFKANCDNRQVAVLVPTTILAQQHLSTFRDRLKDFPLRIEMLSRFKTRQEQKAIVQDLAEGKVDVVIGTHRLLSADIQFANLGLLIVDEEHRFGVGHKEKIKNLKRQVDVLALSATPIPRTMQMSLLGARDMSIIETSPKDRLPITTEICEFHPETIRQAVMRELARGGQVYFVHNRVQTILSINRYLSKLMPPVRIAVAHGQMPEKELEEVMLSFLSRHYDILLSTSIIESGLDIPRVNTIVINRADRFGLAQLYQLRGRVGRSTREATAYLLVPPFRILSANARKRLKAIEQHTDLGSGFHLAMKDLEIRGAGNLLGPQQHGFIEEVGFDLYLKLLNEAIGELKGEPVAAEVAVKFEVDWDLFLPGEYVPTSQQKVEIYQKLAQADSYAKINDLKLEVIDRFGPLPPAAENLFVMAEAKLLASRLGLSKIVYKRGFLKLIYAKEQSPSKRQIAALASQMPYPIEYAASGEFSIIIDFRQATAEDVVSKVRFVLQLLA